MSHEASWMEDRGKSTAATIVFRCLLCTRTISISRKDYDSGKAFPAVSEHE